MGKKERAIGLQGHSHPGFGRFGSSVESHCTAEIFETGRKFDIRRKFRRLPYTGYADTDTRLTTSVVGNGQVVVYERQSGF